MSSRDAESGWSGLFHDAFRRSLNPMALIDGATRVQVEVNNAFARLLERSRSSLIGHPIYEFVEHGPRATPSEWNRAMAQEEITGETELVRPDGSLVSVQFAAYPETVTGRRLVLFVALNTARWGSQFRRDPDPRPRGGELSERELEVIRLIALGASGPEIADQLSISHNTVRTHARNAMETVGARSRAHLVAKVLGEGLALR
jgi:DNA-binding CsgD family transcriptional regulator